MTDPKPETVDGRLLAVRREEMQLAIADVADRLLLSRHQVRALESGEVGAFYNQGFYQQALKRYAALLGLPDSPPQTEPSRSPAVVEVPPESSATMADEPPTAGTAHLVEPAPAAGGSVQTADVTPATEAQDTSGILTTVLVLLVLVGGIYGITHMEQLRTTVDRLLAGGPDRSPVSVGAPPAETPAADSDRDTGAAAPGAAPTETGPPPVARPEAAPPAATGNPAPIPATADPRNAPTEAPAKPRSSGFYQIEAQGLCWVFARDADGKETEVTLRQGERTSFPDNLSFLAIGDINAISLRVGGVERDLAGLSKDGRVVRLRQSDLERLRGENALR